MFAMGHIALGYLLGRTTSKITGVNLRLPLIVFLSILPDLDLFIPFLVHRGPTHSIFFAITLFIPFFVIGMRKSLPYFSSLVSHSLVGDAVTRRGCQLFWPFSFNWFSYPLTLRMGSLQELSIELILFSIALVTLFFSGGLKYFRRLR
jgi:membrane-bound metal-dependent hydrolase YbcI (DUF457 family)